MIEEWKDISGYEGLYQVSNLGRVKSLPKAQCCPNCKAPVKPLSKEVILKGRVNSRGYIQVILSSKSIKKTFNIHRLVGRHFLDIEGINIDEMTIHHKYFDKLNNKADNLEWCYLHENIEYSVDAGKHHAKTNKNKSPFFSTKKNHKLKPEDVVEIRNLLDRGTKLKEISDRYSVSESLISNIKNNKMWVNYDWESENVNY